MHPLILQIGPLNIYSYGVMMAVAIIVCTFLLNRDARAVNIPSDVIFDLVFWMVFGGILGARILFVVLHWEFFLAFPIEIIKIQSGGLSWQGGLVTGFLIGLAYVKKKKLSALRTLDLVAPYMALGQSIGRIGCFFNGCCYGKETLHGIYFPAHEAILHPTQLYSSFGLLMIFVILKLYKTHAKAQGHVFCLYIILASIQRFIIEFVRDDRIVLNIGISIPQLISLIVLGFGFYFFVHLSQKSKQS